MLYITDGVHGLGPPSLLVVLKNRLTVIGFDLVLKDPGLGLEDPVFGCGLGIDMLVVCTL